MEKTNKKVVHFKVNGKDYIMREDEWKMLKMWETKFYDGPKI